jgi:type I restriction enzyme R subunit
MIRRPDTSTRYTPNLNTKAKRALYDNLNQNEELALVLDEIILKTKKADWRGNLQKEREIKKAILSVVKNENEVERIFELVKNQTEY